MGRRATKFQTSSDKGKSSTKLQRIKQDVNQSQFQSWGRATTVPDYEDACMIGSTTELQ